MSEGHAVPPATVAPEVEAEVSSPTAAPTRRQGSRVALLVGLLLAIGGVVAGGVSFWVAERSDETATTQGPVAAVPATLTVVVQPWGYVWIDDEPRGRAPIEDVTLEPGRHRVSAGGPTPTVTRTVELRAGQHEVIEFDLSD
jgi:hypothetical protein